MLLAGGLQSLPLGGEVSARSAEELPACRLALLEQRADLQVAHLEDLVQQEHGALGGSQTLEQDEEGHRDLVERLHCIAAHQTEVHRLRQPVSPALLASR